MRRIGPLAALVVWLVVVVTGCGGTDSATSESAIPVESPQEAAQRTKPDARVPPTPPPEELVVEDLIEGNGKEAEKGDRVTIRYVGLAWDGEVYGDAWSYSEPPRFTLGRGQLAVGFEEGLVGMKAGGRREIVVPISQLRSPKFDEFRERVPLKPPDTLFLVVDLLAVS